MKFKDYERIMGVAPEADAATLALKWYLEVSTAVGTERRFTGLVTFGMVVPIEPGFAETDLQGPQMAERLRAAVPSQFWMNP